jgi:hypothetical protein
MKKVKVKIKIIIIIIIIIKIKRNGKISNDYAKKNIS